MKIRLLAMGAILTVLGLGLLASRGLAAAYLGVSLMGMALLVVAYLWNPSAQMDLEGAHRAS